MKKRKFAIIFDDLDWTTVNKNVGLIAQFLAKKNIEVEFITSKENKNKKVFFQTPLISITRILAGSSWPQLNHDNFKKYFAKNINSYFAVWVYRGRPYSQWVIEEARKRNIVTIIKLDSDYSLSKFGIVFLRICKKMGLPPNRAYMNIRGLIKLLSFIPTIKGFHRYDSIFFTASLVLCETPEIEMKLKREIPNIQTFFLPNSIPVYSFKKIEKSFKNIKEKKKKIIISVGRIVPVKQYENGIKAFALLPEEIKKDWTYEIIGPVYDRSYLISLKKLIKELQLNNRIKIILEFFGRELYLKYFESSILLMPYDNSKGFTGREGQPNVITEGMFFRNAIITTLLPGTRFLLRKSGGGILAGSNGPEILSLALIKLIQNTKLRTTMQDNAQKFIEEKLNLDVIGESLYSKIFEIDYGIYISDQKSDTLALEPAVIEGAIVRYLNFFTRKSDKIIDFFHAKILDIGCREFFTYDYFRKKYNTTILGVDMGGQALEYARHKGIINVDIHHLDKLFPRSSFDVILSFHVFEHAYDLEKVLKNCYKLLKSGGILFFAIPMPSIDTRRSHWVDIPNIALMKDVLVSVGFKPVFYKSFQANIFRNEPEMIGIFQKQ